jgi:tryptophan-rich sensory protein
MFRRDRTKGKIMERLVAQVPAGWLAAAAAFGAVALTSWIGSAATAPGLIAWYPSLAKPWFTPPNWAFPVAWTTLFAMMAYASWLVWMAGGRRAQGALAIYGGHLALNALWSIAFFGFQSPGAGLVAIVPFTGSIVATMIAFRAFSRRAAWLLAPYLAWVGFAALLNAAIWMMNQGPA